MDRVEESIARKYRVLGALFDERGRRLWAAVEAGELGRGGISLIARATGLSRNTISRGLGELVGDFRNGGREWRPRGEPEEVRTHDFMDRDLGKVNPYGVYDQSANVGWVSVGTDHDTAEFAVESIRRWWLKMGAARYPRACDLLITADGGGSNGYRLRLWKVALQGFADETG